MAIQAGRRHGGCDTSFVWVFLKRGHRNCGRRRRFGVRSGIRPIRNSNHDVFCGMLCRDKFGYSFAAKESGKEESDSVFAVSAFGISHYACSDDFRIKKEG